MADLYPNFAALRKQERERRDYRIRLENRETPVVLLAPHGGAIEPGTSEIAGAIARDDLSMYAFEGLRQRSRELHITSHRFDEPECLKLVADARTAIAIHGRTDGDDSETISLGGLNAALGNAIAGNLREAGFAVAPAGDRLAARDGANICNRGSSSGGVQLELPRTLRDQLVHDVVRLKAFSDAVRDAIFSHTNKQKADPGSSPG